MESVLVRIVVSRYIRLRMDAASSCMFLFNSSEWLLVKFQQTLRDFPVQSVVLCLVRSDATWLTPIGTALQL